MKLPKFVKNLRIVATDKKVAYVERDNKRVALPRATHFTATDPDVVFIDGIWYNTTGSIIGPAQLHN